MISHRVWLDSYHRAYVDVQGDVDSVNDAVDLLLERWGPYNPTVTEGPANDLSEFDLIKSGVCCRHRDPHILYKKAQVAVMSASSAVIEYLQEVVRQTKSMEDTIGASPPEPKSAVRMIGLVYRFPIGVLTQAERDEFTTAGAEIIDDSLYVEVCCKQGSRAHELVCARSRSMNYAGRSWGGLTVK